MLTSCSSQVHPPRYLLPPKGKKIPSSVCVALIFIGETPSSHSLKESWIVPMPLTTPTPTRAINCEELYFSILITNLRTLFNDFLYRLYLFVLGACRQLLWVFFFKNLLMGGQLGGLTDKGACCSAWWPELSPWTHMTERPSSPKLSPDLHMWTIYPTNNN